MIISQEPSYHLTVQFDIYPKDGSQRDLCTPASVMLSTTNKRWKQSKRPMNHVNKKVWDIMQWNIRPALTRNLVACYNMNGQRRS